jgi:hypothetical protein
MASEVEPPFVSAAENKGWLHSALSSFLLIERNLGYAAWLHQPPALGAPVAMTFLGNSWIYQ